MSALKDIIIVYPERETALAIRSFIVKNGFGVSRICSHASTALEFAGICDGQGIIVCPFIMSDMSAVDLAQQLPPGFDVIAFSKNGAEQYTDNLITMPVPVNRFEFIQVLSVLYSSKASFAGAEAEDERVSAAKQALMAEKGMSEMQAHKYLQRESMKSGKRILQLAAEILDNRGGNI